FELNPTQQQTTLDCHERKMRKRMVAELMLMLAFLLVSAGTQKRLSNTSNEISWPQFHYVQAKKEDINPSPPQNHHYTFWIFLKDEEQKQSGYNMLCNNSN
ncbi:hypothetical protein PROFUN_17141, partial [Planoprotostelium fungivorum]